MLVNSRLSAHDSDKFLYLDDRITIELVRKKKMIKQREPQHSNQQGRHTWQATAIYSVVALFSASMLALSLYRGYLSWIDSALSLIAIVACYVWVPLDTPAWVLALCAVPAIMANSIPLDVYSYFILPTIGFDKFQHFTTALLGMFVLIWILRTHFRMHNIFLIGTTALLVLMGIGALVEITEFTGSIYLGLHGFVDQTDRAKYVTIFSMHDTLPETRSILQEFDSIFDMIFQLLGEVTALTVCGLIYVVRRHHGRY